MARYRISKKNSCYVVIADDHEVLICADLGLAKRIALDAARGCPPNVMLQLSSRSTRAHQTCTKDLGAAMANAASRSLGE